MKSIKNITDEYNHNIPSHNYTEIELICKKIKFCAKHSKKWNNK